MRYAAALLLLFRSVAAVAACPERAPGNFYMSFSPVGQGPAPAQPNGPLTLELRALPSAGFPPAVPDEGYTIQPCDTITWDFGDGTTESVTGRASVTHDFPVPENYTIRATVTN